MADRLITERQVFFDAMGGSACCLLRSPKKGRRHLRLSGVGSACTSVGPRRQNRPPYAIEVEPNAAPRLEPLPQDGRKGGRGSLHESAVGNREDVPRRRYGARAPANAAPAPAAGGPDQRGLVPGVETTAIVAVASGKGGSSANNESAATWRCALKANNGTCAWRSLQMLTSRPYDAALLGISEDRAPIARRKAFVRPLEKIPGVRDFAEMSMGFSCVWETSRMNWRGPMVMSALQQMLRRGRFLGLRIEIMVSNKTCRGNRRRAADEWQAGAAAGAVCIDTAGHRLLDAAKGGLKCSPGRSARARNS